jgi:predicted O-linked N-acetylglucosamine transferase (SPINDLY family)
MFDVWMRILQQVPGSVLWLQGGSHENVKENLRREAQARGVQPDRLVFAARMELMAEHLARHRAADFFLDTLPFNAHTTAADALWAGLPVLTCLGESSLGRIAGSLLMALDMPELVMQDIQAYEAMAVKLGTDKGLVQQLKNKLDQHRLSTPMFDMERLTKNIEATFAYLYQNYHAT